MIVAMLMGCADAGGETGGEPELVWVRDELVCTSDQSLTWAPPEDVRIAALHAWGHFLDPETGDSFESNVTAQVEAGIYGWKSENHRFEFACGGSGTYETEYVITWAYWEE